MEFPHSVGPSPPLEPSQRVRRHSLPLAPSNHHPPRKPRPVLPLVPEPHRPAPLELHRDPAQQGPRRHPALHRTQRRQAPVQPIPAHRQPVPEQPTQRRGAAPEQRRDEGGHRGGRSFHTMDLGGPGPLPSPLGGEAEEAPLGVEGDAVRVGRQGQAEGCADGAGEVDGAAGFDRVKEARLGGREAGEPVHLEHEAVGGGAEPEEGRALQPGRERREGEAPPGDPRAQGLEPGPVSIEMSRGAVEIDLPLCRGKPGLRGALLAANDLPRDRLQDLLVRGPRAAVDPEREARGGTGAGEEPGVERHRERADPGPGALDLGPQHDEPGEIEGGRGDGLTHRLPPGALPHVGLLGEAPGGHPGQTAPGDPGDAQGASAQEQAATGAGGHQGGSEDEEGGAISARLSERGDLPGRPPWRPATRGPAARRSGPRRCSP